MPNPTASLATLRPDLATFLEWDLASENAGYVATKVCPVINVAAQAGNFGKIPVEQLLQARTTRRAPGSGYARGEYAFTSSTYATEEHGAEEVVDDRQAKMYAEYFNAEQVATMRAFSSVLRNAEQRVADMIFNATTWNGASLATAVGTEWSTVSSTPIANVEAAVKKIYENSGLWANALVINRRVFRNLRLVTEVRDAIEASGAGTPAKARDVTVEMLKAVFDLDHIIVAGTSKNSANEGQAATFAEVWSPEYAMVCRISESADMADPCVGRCFHWAADGSNIGGTVESYRDEAVRGGVVRVRHDVAEKVLYTEAGHLLSNITA